MEWQWGNRLRDLGGGMNNPRRNRCPGLGLGVWAWGEQQREEEDKVGGVLSSVAAVCSLRSRGEAGLLHPGCLSHPKGTFAPGSHSCPLTAIAVEGPRVCLCDFQGTAAWPTPRRS